MWSLGFKESLDEFGERTLSPSRFKDDIAIRPHVVGDIRHADAQSRRLRMRVKGQDGKMYLPHTLNNTVVAPPRMLIAYLENHLQADGSVTIADVLVPYMGGTTVLIPKK